MDLPSIGPVSSDGELAAALLTAAATLEQEGRKAIAGSVINAGTRMLTAARALSTAALAVLRSAPDRSDLDLTTIRDARACVAEVASAIHWHADVFQAYWAALGRMLPGEEESASVWPVAPRDA